MITTKTLPLISIIILFTICSVSAQEVRTLDKVIVKLREDSKANNGNAFNYQPGEIISNNKLKLKHLNTITDVLNYVSGLDLRSRGSFGIQADISLRGSTFEQTALLIDGQRLNDPQTAHHNLDIPLTVFDIDRVEIIRDGASSSFGSGALAGSINFITKKPDKRIFNLQTLFGQYALFGQGISLTLPSEALSGRFSFEHKISSGARPNTDFETTVASLYFLGDWGNRSADLFFGHQKKDFGASTFYSNLFPEEQEHTQTEFLRAGLNMHIGEGLLTNNIFLRKHWDKFILRRNKPTSVNYHTTYLYGVNSSHVFPTKLGDFYYGFDAGRDEINSSNLGKHSRIHEAFLTGILSPKQNKLTAYLKFRSDHYQEWSWNYPFDLGLGYEINEVLRLKSSFSRSFRVPSFTELYYYDPANIGNPNLQVERSDNYSFGSDCVLGIGGFGIDIFLRRGRNLIDWTRSLASDPWQATNSGKIDTKGIDFTYSLNPDIDLVVFSQGRITFSYTYLDSYKKNSRYLSKYALDILQHNLNLQLIQRLLGVDLDWKLSYKQRYYGQEYFVGNVYLSKKIIMKNLILEPFIKVDNLTNIRFSEVADVVAPGRWIQGGFKLEW